MPKQPQASDKGPGQIKAVFQEAHDPAQQQPAAAAAEATSSEDWLASQDRFMSLANGIMQAGPAGNQNAVMAMAEQGRALGSLGQMGELPWPGGMLQLPAAMQTTSWPLHRDREQPASSQNLPRTISADATAPSEVEWPCCPFQK